MFPTLHLRHWLPLSILAVMVLLLAGLSWLNMTDYQNRALASTEERLLLQGRVMQHHIEEELRASTLDDIQDEFALLAMVPGVQASALLADSGEVMTGSRLEWRNVRAQLLPNFDEATFKRVQASNQASSVWSGDMSYLALYMPIALSSPSSLRPATGVLFISYDNRAEMRITRQQVGHRLLLFLLASALCVIPLMVLINRRLLRPLRSLSGALRAFGKGEHHVRLPMAADRELGSLTRAFNDMAIAQQELLEEVTMARRNLAATLDSIGDAVLTTDDNGCITRMNTVAEELTGWPLAEAAGRPVEDVLVLRNSKTREFVPMPVRHVLATGEVMLLANHTLLIRRDESECHIADSAAPIRDSQGKTIGVVMVCRNVDEEYALKEALREREAIYRLMTEQTSSFDYWLAPQGHFRYLSPSCQDVTGYGVREFGKTIDFLVGITHPEDQEMVHRHSDDVSQPGHPHCAVEFRIVTRNGQVRWLHHVCQDVFGEDGTWQGRRASNLDITDRKIAESELNLHARDLERLVAERTEALQRSNQALMEASRTKDLFLATVSHELRTPLTAILGTSELLREQHNNSLTPRQLRQIRQIEDSGRHLLDVINDILDVAKIEAGTLTLKLGEVDVPKLLDTSLAMVRESARIKDIRLSMAADGRVEHIHGDARRLKQALVNLLTNAVKFTPPGGQMGLDVFGDDEANEVRFTVWDTGIGMSPEEQARLFQPFSQVDSRLDRIYEGAGLGLVLVKHMADLHHGRLEVNSSPKEGSHFSLILPWAFHENHEEESNQDNAAAAPSLRKEAQPGKRILLVDDNEVNREMAREYLTICGHEVVVAADGQEALDILRESPLPDLMLLDIQMPVMDGPTTLAHLRGDQRTAGLPVVALTALAMVGDRERLLEQGFDAYLAKPYQFDALERIVQDTIRRPA